MSAVLDLAVRVAALESGVAELESWRRDVEREVGDEDLLLGGAVLEDEERRKEAAARQDLIGDLIFWRGRPRSNADDLSEILDRHLGPVQRRLSSAERAAAESVLGPIDPRPLTPAEIEACRRAAETPLQALAREVVRRWIDASGFALKAGEG